MSGNCADNPQAHDLNTTTDVDDAYIAFIILLICLWFTVHVLCTFNEKHVVPFMNYSMAFMYV